MGDATETVHVVHGPSRAETVRGALRSLGCDERIIGLPGELNFGPIDPPDPDARRAWIRTILRCDPADHVREPEAPWADATSAHVHPVYWVCMSDAGEQASFLEFACRMAGRLLDIVDATGLDLVTPAGVRSPRSLGALRERDIVASGLKERRRAFSQGESDAASAAWSLLRRENAPLRVVRDGCLVSAPLTYFDAVLMGLAMREWEVVARLIGRAIHHLTFDVDPPDQGVGDVVLFGRVLALGDAGDLEVRGAGPGMRAYEVRRPRTFGHA
ncbi:DUF3658 domain-containing protein [Methylobacterium mesophilicum]|uniref:DUF3658 domain-containing protein n=1 Tax=Methylobacterium mesophilicum TaxID=39956 RepID=UPI001EE354E2|nr:DUF3658 domain-containing protein [Methylobacterium mesophilicum]GJE23069.1 hypothetical protein JHFBIEKO_3530 [Methylobacterium mesophilicum]